MKNVRGSLEVGGNWEITEHDKYGFLARESLTKSHRLCPFDL